MESQTPAAAGAGSVVTGHQQGWDLAGRLVLRGNGLDPAQQAAVARELDPFPAGATTGPADLLLTGGAAPSDVDVVERHGPAKDATTTGRDRAGRLVLWCGGGWVVVPVPEEAPAEIALGRVDPRACWSALVRPAMQLALHRHDAVAVHAAAVELGGRGVLLSGWSESGKTEVALAMMEGGASFLSDKWTVVGVDGEVSAFPVEVGVRGWALEALPRLRASLPAAARAQLSAARAAGSLLRPSQSLRGRGGAAGLAAGALGRAVELGDRAGLSPSALLAAYGERSEPARRLPLETVVVLVTGASEQVRVTDADATWAAGRLARSAAYERRAWSDLQERGAYAGLSGRSGARDAAVQREEELLGQALGRAARVLRVDCPFPGDPRRVVEALAAAGAA